ncbi:hypothetical protein [Microvirga calopogonii]|uniref:hypothetical protein n=1 Tax=Microvirga calopogonii TaxID=2078013 RepID=UPI000E0CC410|nr:hypothetical protein [Microvirga calopogonii]
MRALTIAITLGLLAISQVTHAKEERKPSRQTPTASTSKADTAEGTDAVAKAARERDEARQRAWDQKTKNITRGICSGC